MELSVESVYSVLPSLGIYDDDPLTKRMVALIQKPKIYNYGRACKGYRPNYDEVPASSNEEDRMDTSV